MSSQVSRQGKAKNFAAVFLLTSVFLCFGLLSTHLRSLSAPFSISSNLSLDQQQKTKSTSTNIDLPTRENVINGIVRKLLSGAVFTVAGDGSATYGMDGGLATGTGLHEPSNVAFDADGNMYIADSLNSRIRLVMKGTGIITTVAGKGGKGYTGDGGQATSAELGQPRSVVVDAAGDLYIADTDNHCIRKVTKSTGVITTVAGTGMGGFNNDGQLATTAQLTSPFGVAVDANGDLYIADTYNHRIRMVTKSSGIISTMAGTGVVGFDGTPGPATSHPLSNPLAVILDAEGNIVFSDSKNNCVRMVSKNTNILSIIAGVSLPDYGGDNGDAKDAFLSFPAGLALDGGGNIYIADSANNVIRLWTKSNGFITTVAGNGMAGYDLSSSGDPATAMFSSPLGVALDKSGYLYVSDTNNNRIRAAAITTQPQPVFPLAVSSAPSALPITLSPSPSPVAIVTSKPSIAPTDPVPIATGPATMTTVAGDGTQQAAVDNILAKGSPIAEPTGVAFDADGNIYIADGLHHRIRLVTKSTGIISTIAGTGTAGFSGDGGQATAANLNLPRNVALDAAGDVYIADTDNHCIRKVTKSTGVITTVAGTGTKGFNEDGQLATTAQLFSPNGLAFDAEGNLYIADTYNHRVRKVTKSTGIISAVAGDGFQGLGGNLATNSGLYYPHNIALDAEGNVFIADSYDNEIRMVTKKTGFISTLVGLTTSTGSALPGFSGDGGDGKVAALNTPLGLAVDAGGNIFIADFGNNAIRLWTKDTGIITTVAGRGQSTAEGTDATSFQLNGPVNINISPSGVLYISDTNANYVRSFTPKVAPTSSPTASPTLEPSAVPTVEPTESPIPERTRKPTNTPTAKPTESPVFSPTKKPTNTPTEQPTYFLFTSAPSDAPSTKRSKKPTMSPEMDTNSPTVKQSSNVVTNYPSEAPNMLPSDPKPSKAPANVNVTSRPTKAKCPCRTVKRPTRAPTVRPPSKKPSTKRPSRKSP